MTLYDKILEAIKAETYVSFACHDGEEYVNGTDQAAESCSRLAIRAQIDLCNHFLSMCQGMNEDDIYKMIETQQKQLGSQL